MLGLLRSPWRSLEVMGVYEMSWEVLDGSWMVPGRSWENLGVPGRAWEDLGSLGRSCEYMKCPRRSCKVL